MSKPTLRRLTAEWLQTLAVAGKSEHTIRAYRRDLRSFLDLLPANCGPEAFTRLAVRSFLASGAAAGLGGAALRRRLASVKSFADWLVTIDALEKNPAERLPQPRMPSRLPQVISPRAVNEMIKATDDDGTFAVRNVAFACLLYATGARVAELVGLDVEDVDLGAREALIRHAKRDKQRLVLFGERAARALGEWLAVRPRLADRHPTTQTALFISKSGRRYHTRDAHRIVTQSAALADVEASPHTLRHCCASHLLDGGAPLPMIAAQLGHERLTATTIYTAVSPARLKRVFQQSHPHAKEVGHG